ncbi:hypothetical protein [Edaphobacter modestus]|uniref:Uncharacterized protein n=1 Tax=Edaphobacter modestus TaxID=388466 RepID=A0A4Q7YPY3_9BACT|nr:hypothetical protein [Edaphobacter modestus]RZU39174.1 hypothetical protein BDD14_0521 [Edaphobacter modestus]
MGTTLGIAVRSFRIRNGYEFRQAKNRSLTTIIFNPYGFELLDVLKRLHSADQIRTKTSGFVQTWEEKAYSHYNRFEQGILCTLAYAHTLVDETKIFFK